MGTLEGSACLLGLVFGKQRKRGNVTVRATYTNGSHSGSTKKKKGGRWACQSPMLPRRGDLVESERSGGLDLLLEPYGRKARGTSANPSKRRTEYVVE